MASAPGQTAPMDQQQVRDILERSLQAPIKATDRAGRLRGGERPPEGESVMSKRVLFFAYGVACYLVFLATLLYAIGFIGSFGVPRTLDGAPTKPLGRALAIDVGLLGLFAVQHSVMARRWFKEAWTRLVPPPIERSTYVLFSSLALILMFWQWRPLGGEVWSVEDPVGRMVLRGLFACGWGLVLVATFLINHFDLFGLRQAWLQLLGRPYAMLPFRTPGPYRLVRHPLYVGWFFAFWMTPTMTLSHLLFALTTSAYILIAIQFEERDLVREHGAAYETYRRSVPMLIPLARRPATPSPTERNAALLTSNPSSYQRSKS
jgi:protein-S-isoprenylcysteine O-methyltransferase Ste14